MKKKLLVALGVFALLILCFAVAAWYFMSRPMYQPGMARALVTTALTRAQGPDYWTVAEGVRLYHFAAGAGRNVLVVHGGPGMPFRAPLDALSPLGSTYRFVYYDQRGCGRSTHPINRFASGNYFNNVAALNGSLGLATQVADIERIRRILGDEKLVILGHSFGGFLASLYAAEFPERVTGLVLAAPADLLVMPIQGGGLFEEVNRRIPAQMKQEYAAYMERYMDFRGLFAKSESDLRALNAGFAKYYAAAAGPSVKIDTAAMEYAGGWMVPALYLGMGRRHDYREPMRRVTAPVLVIHGANDLQPEQASRAYASAFPNARFRLVSGAGHFIFDDKPAEFAAAVDDFLRELK